MCVKESASLADLGMHKWLHEFMQLGKSQSMALHVQYDQSNE